MEELDKWLISFYGRFADDVQVLLNQEPFWKICHSCTDGHCCRRSRIPVMRLEWDNIRRYVKENFSKRNKNRFLENVESKSEKCPFLFGHRCSVYSVRPWACRICPYIVSFYSHGVSSESSRIYLPSCPTLAGAFGVKQGEVTTHEVTALERHKEGSLVRCHFQKPHPLWLIDASDYFKEYDETLTGADDERLEKRDLHDWIGLSKFMRDKGEISQKKFLLDLGLD